MKGVNVLDLVLHYIGWMRAASEDVIRLKAARSYLKTVKTARLLARDVVIMICCAVFAGSGLALLPVTILLYAPWEAQTKMIVAGSLLLGYIGVSLFVFLRMFSQKKWMRLSHADELMDSVLGSVRERSSIRPAGAVCDEEVPGDGGRTRHRYTRT